ERGGGERRHQGMPPTRTSRSTARAARGPAAARTSARPTSRAAGRASARTSARPTSRAAGRPKRPVRRARSAPPPLVYQWARVRWDRIGRTALLIVLVVVAGLYVQHIVQFFITRANADTQH